VTASVDVADVPIRDAATVVLLRDTPDGLQVWLQQRSPTLVFAGGMHAFPGGSVEAPDRAAMVAGTVVARHRDVWSCGSVEATTLIGAALRETEEEAGVRLAPDSLVPWARWLTPVGEPRRFDARFYLAAMPADQQARPLTSEVHDAQWIAVRAAVRGYEEGQLGMYPPTIAVLTQVSSFDDVASTMAAAPPHIQRILG